MITPLTNTATSSRPGQSRRAPHVAGKLIAALAGSSNHLLRMADHPLGVSVGLALGYMILSGAYIFLSGRIAADSAMSAAQLRNWELLKGLGFVLITGAAYFAFAYHQLRRIANQQRHLSLIFQSVSDSLFLLQVEPEDCYRFLCVNASFLKTTGLSREQVLGKRIEEVFPAASQVPAKQKYHEAIQGCKSVSWEQTASYPAGQRVSEVTITPLANRAGRIDQLAGGIRDITDRKLAEQEREACTRRLQVLSHRLVNAQETERRRIARELHDEVGQALTATQMNLQAVLQSPKGDTVPARVKECLGEVENVMEQLHDISLDLRPSMLDDLGLEPALRWYTNRQAGLTGLQANFLTDLSGQRCNPIIETECFRIAQEALTNVVRHARAKTVTVELYKKDGCLHLKILDDGIGFATAPVRRQAVRGASLGLLSMEERATLAGGKLKLDSAPGQGTEVHAWFPLETQPSNKHEYPCETHSGDPGR